MIFESYEPRNQNLNTATRPQLAPLLDEMTLETLMICLPLKDWREASNVAGMDAKTMKALKRAFSMDAITGA